MPGTSTLFLRELMDPAVLRAFIAMANEVPSPRSIAEIPEHKRNLDDWHAWSFEDQRLAPPEESTANRCRTVAPEALPTRVDTPLPSAVPERCATPPRVDTHALVERLIQEYQTVTAEDPLPIDARESDATHP